MKKHYLIILTLLAAEIKTDTAISKDGHVTTPSVPKHHWAATILIMRILKGGWPSLQNEIEAAALSKTEGSEREPLAHSSKKFEYGEHEIFEGSIKVFDSEDPSAPWVQNVQVTAKKEWTEHSKKRFFLPQSPYWKKESPGAMVCRDEYTQCELGKGDNKAWRVKCTSYMPLKLFLMRLRAKSEKPQPPSK